MGEEKKSGKNEKWKRDNVHRDLPLNQVRLSKQKLTKYLDGRILLFYILS